MFHFETAKFGSQSPLANSYTKEAILPCNGRTYSLEIFTGLHRGSYVTLQEDSKHMRLQIPTEHKRVHFLIKNTPNNDSDLSAAIASVQLKISVTWKNVDSAATLLITICTYAKLRPSNNMIK